MDWAVCGSSFNGATIPAVRPTAVAGAVHPTLRWYPLARTVAVVEVGGNRLAARFTWSILICMSAWPDPFMTPSGSAGGSVFLAIGPLLGLKGGKSGFIIIFKNGTIGETTL